MQFIFGDATPNTEQASRVISFPSDLLTICDPVLLISHCGNPIWSKAHVCDIFNFIISPNVNGSTSHALLLHVSLFNPQWARAISINTYNVHKCILTPLAYRKQKKHFVIRNIFLHHGLLRGSTTRHIMHIFDRLCSLQNTASNEKKWKAAVHIRTVHCMS